MSDIMLTATAGKLVWLGGLGVNFKLHGDDTGGAFSIVEHPVKPGALVPPHTHTHSEQGLEMGRPSFIRVRIEQAGEQITGVHVGGQCYWMGEGTIEVPESEILS